MRYCNLLAWHLRTLYVHAPNAPYNKEHMVLAVLAFMIEVFMNKRLSGLLTMSVCLFAGTAGITTAQAVETKSISTVSQDNSAHIDRVLSELTRQHDGASSLVKSARQPTSLALNSPLLAQDTSAATNDEDVLERLTAVASNSVSKFKQTGLASWYGRQFHGRKTASGDIFDMNALTAAHRSLPLNCYVKVTNKSNGKSVVVKVNDRGPFHGNRVMDLSYGAAKQLGITSKGVGNVSIERVSGP